MFEVEMKFRLTNRERFLEKIAEYFGVAFGPAVIERDLYFQHPSRDFAQTDEALRLREVENDIVMTYKGPKIDPLTKTREEIELPLIEKIGENAPFLTNSVENRGNPLQKRWSDGRQLLERLGFRPVAEVKKMRQTTRFSFGSLPFKATLDGLDGIGDFAELETLTDSDLESARRGILALADKLELTELVRQSYLELVLQKRENG